MASGLASSQLNDLKTAVNALPGRVTQALKGVARDTAARIVEGYRQRLLAQTNAHRTAASAVVLDETADKRFVAHVPGDSSHTPELPFYFEYGTERMPAKPALRPAGDSENARYKSDMAKAAEDALRDVARVLE